MRPTTQHMKVHSARTAGERGWGGGRAALDWRGLYLLSIWLIEYDKDLQAVAATRLPPPVLAAHVVLAGGSLLLWIYYLLYDDDGVARISAAGLSAAAVLGLVMALRWISVYRAKRDSIRLERIARLAAPRCRSAGPAGAGRGGPAGTELSAAGRDRAWRLRGGHADISTPYRVRGWQQLTRPMPPEPVSGPTAPRPPGPFPWPPVHPGFPCVPRAAPRRRSSRSPAAGAPRCSCCTS